MYDAAFTRAGNDPWVLDYEPNKGPRYRIKVRLCESQNYRCCICGNHIEAMAFNGDPKQCALASIDRTKPTNYKNEVVVCQSCAGPMSGYTHLLDYYNAVHSGQIVNGKKVKAEKVRVVHTETIPLIKQLLAEQGYSSVKVPVDYQYAPPTTAPKIAKFLSAAEKRQENKKSKHRPPPWFRWRDEKKRELMECQNHKCCYCGSVMTVEFLRHPRYATWEHVIELSKGGTWDLDNLVIACSVCNHLRSAMKLDAYEFYEWAKDHLAEIEERVRNRFVRARNYNRPPIVEERKTRSFMKGASQWKGPIYGR
jgi:5-methylcytosine-specific restriction endonuclease McrA